MDRTTEPPSFVALLAPRRVVVEDLITAKFPIDDAASAYDQLINGPTSPLGLLLTYGPSPLSRPSDSPGRRARTPLAKPAPAVGLIGAGGFSQRVLIPALRDAGFKLSIVASATGLSAVGAAHRFGFERTGTPEEVLEADDLDVLCIASRHASHSEYALKGLERGLAVFASKSRQPYRPRISTRFRRHPTAKSFRSASTDGLRLAIAMRHHVTRAGQPVELLYRVAAGRLSQDHWLNDCDDGGGRYLGEGCHFVDFACWFIGMLPIAVEATLPGDTGQPLGLSQRFSVTLAFADSSLATIVYMSEPAPAISKEFVEAHAAGRSAVLHDYRRLELTGPERRRVLRDPRRDKGHRAQFAALRKALAGEPVSDPSPLDTMRVTLEALARASAAGRDAR